MTTPPPKKADRKDRLAQALRDNLRRRKDQDRARDAPDAAPDATPDPSEGQMPDTTA